MVALKFFCLLDPTYGVLDIMSLIVQIMFTISLIKNVLELVQIMSYKI